MTALAAGVPVGTAILAVVLATFAGAILMLPYARRRRRHVTFGHGPQGHGINYGAWTGEMSREELLEVLPFCGCASPEDAADALRNILHLFPLHSHGGRDRLMALFASEEVYMLFLYLLDRHELTEHGGTVEGSWLTEKGVAVRDALDREHLRDNFELLFELP